MTTQNKILIIIAGVIILSLGTMFTVRLLSGEDGWLCVDGKWIEHGHPSAEMPASGCGDVKDDVSDENVPHLDSPKVGQIVTSPLKVTGSMPGSWFFEGVAHVELVDGKKQIIATALAQAKGEWMTDKLVPFEAILIFENPNTTGGKLILRSDNPSGLSQNDHSSSYAIKFLQTVMVYFNNNKLDPEMLRCGDVYSANRFVVPTESIGRAALTELLKGTTTAEKSVGYISNINNGVAIKSLTIADGIAKVDFSKELGMGVGGSCKTEAIRAQITQTLKQFATVESVIISIDGRTEDILQP